MSGRAGRPPFNDTGMVIIMTRRETVITASVSFLHFLQCLIVYVYCSAVIPLVPFSFFLCSPFYDLMHPRFTCTRISWMDVRWWNHSMHMISQFNYWFSCSGLLCIFMEKNVCLLIKLSTFSCFFRLLSCVTEHLTAEIVQMTISDITQAIEWMKCSYLYVRMKKACILWASIRSWEGHFTFIIVSV